MRDTETVTDILLATGLVAGGVGRHVAQLAAGLTGRGHRVRVACPPVVASRFDLAGAGADVVPVEIGSRPAPLRDRSAVAALRSACVGVDVVHAHGLRAGALVLLARGDAAMPPVVVTGHNAAPHGRVAAVVHRGLERMVYHGADLFLGVSEDLVQRARDRNGCAVARAVVAAVRADPVTSREDVRRTLELGPGEALVVSVGRLAAQKGYDRLLSTVGDLVGDGGQVTVVIAGDGPQREGLQRQIDREGLPARLLGHRDDVPDLLGAADVVVSSARWEGQPVWLQEALSVGAAIVATDVGGTAEVLGGAGILVPPEVPGELTEAIGVLLEDPERLAGLRSGARARAADLPTAADAVGAALAAYECATVIAAGRAPGDDRPDRDVD